jgi:hypothetical protein
MMARYQEEESGKGNSDVDSFPPALGGEGLGASPALSRVLIALLKGVLIREGTPLLWQSLLKLSSRVRDYVTVLGLDLFIDETEGFAYLKQKEPVPGVSADSALPSLIPKRQLGYQVSLLLVLIRSKLAEFDAKSGDSRLILSADDMVDQMRVFLPETKNDVRLKERVLVQVNRIVEMGFLRKLKGQSKEAERYEVNRILKAFVDAQWLDDFDQRLSEYASLSGSPGDAEGGEMPEGGS